jgi:hypothetical protein
VRKASGAKKLLDLKNDKIPDVVLPDELYFGKKKEPVSLG